MGVVDYEKQGSIGTTLLPKRYDIDIYGGDTFDVLLTFTDSNNAAVDLTGFTGLVQFKDVNNMVMATPTVTVNDNGVIGNLRIYIMDTSNIVAGTYQWDLQLTDSSGRRRTYIGGLVSVVQDISE